METRDIVDLGSFRTEESGTDAELAAVEVELLKVKAEIEKLTRRKELLLKRREELKDNALIEKSKLLASHNWSRTDHEWSDAIVNIRRKVFKLDSFREHQLPTINALLSEKDVILLMPTGGGKSLCYQLPALYLSGLTLVVSPLLALMEDQIMALNALNVSAKTLCSNSTKEEVNHIQQEMVTKNSKLKLLYVTPEKLAKSKRFMSKLQKCYQMKQLSLIAIDEVHCCSQWGHDFRPDYKYLSVLKPMFPDVPMLGVTATATVHVLADVQKMLCIQGCLVIKAHFNRPNLYYEVREKSSVHKECVEQLDTLLKNRFLGKSGIIYTTTVNDCEALSKDLKKLGNAVACYHAQLDATNRSKVHSKWLSGTYQAVIATIAFGLGIDKPDVRFVIHHCLSKSMENYYQESGRAGRDGEAADCILFYRLADIFKISTMIYAQQGAIDKLYSMVAYCIDKTRCRREMIASQFEEQWESQDCNEMCDHCRQPREGKEVNITAYCIGLYDLLTKAANIEKRLTAQMVIDTWLDKGPVELRAVTIKKPPIQLADGIIAILLVENYLKEDFQITPYKAITYIKRGPRASTVLSGNHNITMIVSGLRKQLSSSATVQRLDGGSSSADKHNSGIQSESVSLKNKCSSLSVSSEIKKKVSTSELPSKQNQAIQKNNSTFSKAAGKNSNSVEIRQQEKCSSKLSVSKTDATRQQIKSDIDNSSKKKRPKISLLSVKDPKPNNCVVDLCSDDDDDDDSSDSSSFVDTKRKTEDGKEVSKSYKRIKTID